MSADDFLAAVQTDMGQPQQTLDDSESVVQTIEEDLPEDDAEDDDEGPESEPEPEVRKPRKERRRERLNALKLQEKLDEERQARARMEGELAAIRQLMSPQQAQQQRPAVDEYTSRLAVIEREMDKVREDYSYMMSAPGMTDEGRRAKSADYQQKLNYLQRQWMETGAKKVNVEMGLQQGQPQVTPTDLYYRSVIGKAANEHPDLFDGGARQSVVESIHRAAVAQGKPDNEKTLYDSIEQARGVFGLHQKGKPTARAKASTAGIGQGAAPPTTSAGGNRISFTVDEAKIARQMFRNAKTDGQAVAMMRSYSAKRGKK